MKAVIGFLAAAVLSGAVLEAQSFRPDVEKTVIAVRGKYPPQVLADQIGDILNEIAWQHRPNIKLLKKGGGGVCPAPQGVTISCDILIWAPPGTPAEQTVHVDVLSGASAEGLATASPYWKSAGPCTKRPKDHPQGGSNCELKNALEPVAPGGTVDPTPTPTPTPTPVPTTDIKTMLDALRTELLARLAAQEREILAAVANQIQLLQDVRTAVHALDERAAALEKKKLPCIVGSSRVLGAMRFCPEE